MMLNKIRSLFGVQQPQPRAPSNAVLPKGSFSLSDGRCHGTVSAPGHDVSRPLTVTLESTAGQELARTVGEPDGPARYAFAFDLPPSFAPASVLAGSAGVFAENAYALKGRLELEPSCEIALIRDQPDPVRTVLCDLTFVQDGTAGPCLGSGWGGQEESSRCTEGPRATLELPVPTSPGTQYELTIDCFAFTLPPHVPAQRMTVTLNGFPQVIDTGHDRTDPVRLVYPTRSLTASPSVLIELDLPNCFRPIDLKLNEDVRRLSFGFRQLTFSQLSF